MNRNIILLSGAFIAAYVSGQFCKNRAKKLLEVVEQVRELKENEEKAKEATVVN